MADATLALARAHMATQVQDAAAVQAALSRLWDETIDPADLTRSFDRFRESAIPYINAGRIKGERTADAYINTVLQFAGKSIAAPAASAVGTRLADGAIKASLTGASAKSLGRAAHLASTGQDPAIALAAAKSNMLGSAKRQVINASRQRITRNRSVGRWARVSDGKPCAFCAMLVSRGPVYSEATVDFPAHDRCGCNARLVLPDDPDGGWSPEARLYRRMWDGELDGHDTFAQAIKALHASPGANPALPAVPAWLRTVQDAAKALPTDRSTLGTVAVAKNPADFTIEKMNELRAKHGVSREVEQAVDRAREKLDELTDLRATLIELGDAADLDEPELWARIVQARGGGTILIRTGSVRGALNDIELAIGQQRRTVDFYDAKITAYRAELKQVRADIDSGKLSAVTKANDLDATGKLGATTSAALDNVRAAGRAIDDEVARRANERGVSVAAARRELDEAKERLATARTAFASDYSDGAREAYRSAAQAYDVAKAAVLTARKADGDIVREVLTELRPMGGGKRPTYSVSRGAALNAMKQAHGNYPDAWNDAAADLFPTVELKTVKRGYNQGGKVIALSKSADDMDMFGVATHELGHSMEKAVPGLRGMEWAYHYSRSNKTTKGGVESLAPRELIYSHIKSEFHVPDDWPENYTGKVYDRGGAGAENSWEVFTTGVESVFNGSPYFEHADGRYDSDFRHFILGALGIL